MSLISLIKSGLAKSLDLYSMQANPWDKFDRPALPMTLTPLPDKAAECTKDLQSFWFDNEILASRIPLTTVPPELDMGDQAIWQGIYTVMLCLQYARAKSPTLVQQISNALNGLYQHQYFGANRLGRSDPFLIRGFDRRSGKWEDNASNDSLSGHFAGLYFILRFGPSELKGRALSLLASLAAELIENKLCLVKADGTPTTYGKLVNGVLTEPLAMTLALGILTVAEHYGLHGKAAAMRYEVYSQYGALIPYPKTIAGTIENWNDDHRAALHLAILALEDRSPKMQELTHAGLYRLWALLERRGNIWVNGLIALGLGECIQPAVKSEMTRQANLVLGEYELSEKRVDTEVDYRGTVSANGKLWSGRSIISIQHVAWAPRIITIKGHQRATQPPPLYISGKQDFVWQRHRYSICDWIGQTQPSQRFNGADFLCAYWASIYSGIIPQPPSPDVDI